MKRRQLLRGVGTVAIGLPFIDAMAPRSVWGGGSAPPIRAFNLFFGLGIPVPLQDEGFLGPMAPLAEVADKLLIVRGVDHVRCNIGGRNAHYDGSTAAFNAIPSSGEVQAGGPSIDQVIRPLAYPKGLPTGTLTALLAGTFFRREDSKGRFIHCWNEDGSPADVPHERPEELFDRLFGTLPDEGDDPQAQKRLRQKRSVLDAIVPDYEHLKSEASNLGAASRNRIADHLENIREYENLVFGEGPDCELPPEPAASTVPHGDAADPGPNTGIDITVDALVSEWRLMADLYALGIQCDVIRFGGLTFQSAGERIRLSGDYEHDGFSHTFADMEVHGVGGNNGCSHEFWHQYVPEAPNVDMRAHIHLLMREIAYFVKKLDDPTYLDSNGKTILDNSLLSISTESGDGRHENEERELSGVFHAFSSANDRLRTGEVVTADAEGLDVYNTIVRDGFGFDAKMGPDERAYQAVPSILA